MRPSSSRCQYVVGTVYGSDRLSVSAPAVVSPAVPRAVPPAVLPATRSTLIATTPNSTRPGTIIDMTALTIPETALVVLVGAGAAAFASRHFPHGQLLVSDAGIAERLRAGELTLVDATDLEPPARARLAALARDQDVPAVAIVLEPPTHLPGFGTAYEPDGDVSVVLEKLACDRRELTGPFDIVGDVHGCRAELVALLVRLGWVLSYDESGRPVGAAHPQRRTAVLLGDLVDRGPDSPGVLRLVMGMVAASTALCVPGNHEQKLLRKLRGRNVRVSHGLAETLAQLSAEPVSLVDDVASFVDSLPSHYVLDGGRLPGLGDGGLRPHTGPARRMGEQHDLPRHRLRVRRLADRAALPRTGARVGKIGRAHV